jgi:hypothetical protein
VSTKPGAAHFYLGGDPFCLSIGIRLLCNNDRSRSLCIDLLKHSLVANGVVSNQGVRHLNHRGRTSVTIRHLKVGASGMFIDPFTNSFRTSMFKTVDGLIIIADDANFALLAQICDGRLLSLVEVLIFIHEKMFIFCMFLSFRILLQISY